jgi:tetratricopeptide (TPR) repeat protein
MKNQIKKVIAVLSFLVLSQVKTVAQQKIDSLLQELKTSSEKEALDIHLSLCYEYSDEVQVLYHAKRAFVIARSLGDSVNIVKSGRLVGRSYKFINQLDSSIDILRYVSPIAKRNNMMFEYGRLQNTLGFTYMLMASYAEALKCHFESLSVMEKLNNQQWMSISLLNIGAVYYKIEDSQKALKYYNRAFKLKQAINYSEGTDILLINMGLCYTQTGEYTTAKRYVENGLSACGGNCSEDIQIQGEYALGVACFLMRTMDESEKHFLQSYGMAKSIKDRRFQFDNIIMLSKIYQSDGRLLQAEKYLREAEKLVPEASYNLEVIKLYKQFSTLYEKMGNERQMVFYQKKYITLRDSVYNENYTNGLMRVQADYLERENKEKIASQQEALNLKDEIIVRQRLLSILVVISSLLLIFLVYVLYKNNKQRKIANQLLDQKVMERTEELESSYRRLRRRVEAADQTNKKTLTEVKSAVATIKKLRSLTLTKEIDSENIQRHLNVAIDCIIEASKKVRGPFVNSSDDADN